MPITIEQTTEHKLARAIAALREIAEAEMRDFGFDTLPEPIAITLRESGMTEGEVMARSLKDRAYVCLLAIDPSYAG